MQFAVLSLRRVSGGPHHTGLMEAEAALAECLAAPVHEVVSSNPLFTRRPLNSRVAQRLLSGSGLVHAYRVDRAAGQTGRADLLVIIANDLHDMAKVTSARGWNRLADATLVFMAETTARHLRIYRDVVLRLTMGADFVFVGADFLPTDPFAKRRVRATGVTAPLVDVLRFPARPHTERPIDVLSYGRHAPTQHDLLRDWSRTTDKFYMYDTGRQVSVWSLAEHRERFVDTATRSRVIITNYARFDEPRANEGRRVMGTRFIEAAAAGAALAGDPAVPNSPDFAGLMGENCMVHLPIDARRIDDRLMAVLIDPGASGALGAAARRFAFGALDVAHQWQIMSAVAGLPEVAGIRARIEKLAAAGG